VSNGGDVASTVRRLEQDVWHGDNRKPGLTTRIQQAEDRLDSGDRRMSAQDKRIDGFANMGWAIILLLLTILGGVVTDIARHH
jgi:hypothetical protein